MGFLRVEADGSPSPDAPDIRKAINQRLAEAAHDQDVPPQ